MVAACHTNNVIHGDVKPANFLLRQLYKDPVAYLEGGNLSGAWMKSVDFGCSQVGSHQQHLLQTFRRSLAHECGWRACKRLVAGRQS